MILPTKQSVGGEGDHEVVEGATPPATLVSAPSTRLRRVPLPRERGRIR